MNLILLMVFMSMALTLVFVVAYLWAMSKGQFDDLDTPAMRILKKESNNNHNQEREIINE